MDKDENLIVGIFSQIQRQKKCNEEVDAICKKYGCVMIVDELRRGGQIIKQEINYIPVEAVQSFLQGNSSSIIKP